MTDRPQITWHRLTLKNTPEPGMSYLIEANYGSGVVHDVAFFNGKRPDGSLWWVLGNCDIDPSLITHYAIITPSKGKP